LCTLNKDIGNVGEFNIVVFGNAGRVNLTNSSRSDEAYSNFACHYFSDTFSAMLEQITLERSRLEKSATFPPK
jgi:hypothetical protein